MIQNADWPENINKMNVISHSFEKLKNPDPVRIRNAGFRSVTKCSLLFFVSSATSLKNFMNVYRSFLKSLFE